MAANPDPPSHSVKIRSLAEALRVNAKTHLTERFVYEGMHLLLQKTLGSRCMAPQSCNGSLEVLGSYNRPLLLTVQQFGVMGGEEKWNKGRATQFVELLKEAAAVPGCREPTAFDLEGDGADTTRYNGILFQCVHSPALQHVLANKCGFHQLFTDESCYGFLLL